ncbi:MAG TPA: PASTA domain-containing protein [Candidatus Omnitrophota bacterium]|nr:PASTA domain-containing protein [Candidatus Omnitrophota bacterium]
MSCLLQKSSHQQKIFFAIALIPFLAFLIAVIPSGDLFAASPDNPDQEDKDSFQVPPIELFQEYSDVKIKIAENFRKVAAGAMTPETFYHELSRMEMPDGLERRHLLMQVKKEIGDYQGRTGQKGLKYFLGELYAEGGSKVEKDLLSWRRQIVLEGIEHVARKFKGKNNINGYKFKVFLGEIGSWPTESLEAMQFAGDIDFTLICGDLELSVAMQQEFDDFIKQRTNLTAEQFDTVCTPQGMGKDEVYVAKHGSKYGEDNFRKYTTERDKKPKIKILDLDNGTIGEIVLGDDAMTQVVLDAKFAKVGMADLIALKWEVEPGMSLEMLRHFEHDIVKKNVYTDLECFMKATKYVERSNKYLREAGAEPDNKALSDFAKLLQENKRAEGMNQVDIIRKYFQEIGKPFPVDVKLGPENETGQSKPEIEVKEAIIKEFYNSCSELMWKNVAKGFDLQMKKLNADIGRLPQPPEDLTKAPDNPEAKRIAKELNQLYEMIEIESRVLNDEIAGIKEIDPGFKSQLEKFRGDYKSFMKTWGFQLLDVQGLQDYKFIDSMLKAKKPIAINLAAAKLLSMPETINTMLDVLDDKLMGEFRGEMQTQWDGYIQGAQEFRWADKVAKFLDRPGGKLSDGWTQWLNIKEELWRGRSERVNKYIMDSLVRQKIKDANQFFGDAMNSSAAGRATSKILITMNLIDEIPAYVGLFWQGEWSALAGEFFKRRVPFGSAATNLYMGKYMAAGWDTLTTLIPPVALLGVAESIGESMGEKTWKMYWSTEVDKFIDDLYENAKFKLLNVETVGDKIKLTNWKLLTVTYQGEEIDLDAFVDKKQGQIREMYAQLKLPQAQRRLQMEYTLDGITGWFKVNDMLRETVAEQDPWLVMMEEMMKHELVGPKLKEHFSDMWYTRWEVVKLEFVKHVIELLEQRRAAEQAEISGQVVQMFEELQKIAEDLRIKKQMMDKLTEEAGGDFMNLLVWLWDMSRGIKREMMGEADVWDVFEEKTRIIDQYLKTYKKIRDTRNETEKQYGNYPKEDDKLRLLSGPYFLMGKASGDETSYGQWAELPGKIREDMTAKLTEIKRKYVPDSALDSDPKSFDQATLGGVSHHDLWRQLWRLVNGKAQPGDTWLQVLSDIPASQGEVLQIAVGMESDTSERDKELQPKGPTDQDLAVERHKVHDEAFDKLIAEFEQHYMRTSNQLGELEKLVAQAEALANEARALCNDCAVITKEVQAGLAEIKSQVATYESKAKNLEIKAQRVKQLTQEINRIQDDAEEGTKFLATSASQMEQLSVRVCEKAQSIKYATSQEERQKIMQSVRADEADLRPMLSQAREKFQIVQTNSKNVRSGYDEAVTGRTELQGFQELDNLIAKVNALEQKIATADEKVNAAREKVAAIAPILAKIDTVAADLRKNLQPIKDTPEGKETLDKIEEMQSRVEGAAQNVVKCPDETAAVIAPLKTQITEMKTNLSKIKTQHAEWTQLFGEAEGSTVSQMLKTVENVEYLGQMAADYMKRVEDAAVDAAFCVTLGEDLMNSPIQGGQPGEGQMIPVPNVIGMQFEQAMGVLQQAGFNPDARTLGDAQRAEDAYMIRSQSPGPNTQAQAGSSVIVQYFGRPMIQCTVPGTQPGYDPQGRPACVCQLGLTWNTSNTACIDCVSYQNNFYGLLDSQQFDAAHALVAQAMNCAWAPQGQQDLLAAMQAATAALQQQQQQNDFQFQQDMQQMEWQRQQQQQQWEQQQQQQQQFNNMMLQNIRNQAQIVSQGGWKPPVNTGGGGGFNFGGGTTGGGGGTTGGGAICPGAIELVGVCATGSKGVSSGGGGQTVLEQFRSGSASSGSHSGGSSPDNNFQGIWGDRNRGGFTFNN